MPVSTISRAPCAHASRTRSHTSFGSVECAGPRAFHTIQKLQRLLQPSCTLMPGRILPVGVGVWMRSPLSSTEPGMQPNSLNTRAATRALLISTNTLSASALNSSPAKLAAQPQATTKGAFGERAARRTIFLVFASASPVTAQVLITIASASA